MTEPVTDVARRAAQANIKPSAWTRLTDWVRKQGGWTLLFVACMLALLLGITILEATNSARGWMKLMTGAIPAWLAFAAGFGLPIGYIGFHRRAMEHWRGVAGVRAEGKAFRAAIVAILAMTASLIGVFANIASETEKSSVEALNSNTERSELYAEIQMIERNTSEERMFREQALAEVTRRQIESAEAEAVGWGMEPIPVPGSENETTVATPDQCAQDLRPRQREICNRLNGDDDYMGLRNELFMAEATVAEIERQRGLLDEKREAYKATRHKDGGAHWSAMATIASGTATSDHIRIWGALFIAFVFLLIAGFGWDEFFERAEEEIGVDL